MVAHAPPSDVRVAREARVALRDGFQVDIISTRPPGTASADVVEGARAIILPIVHRQGAGLLGALWEYVAFTALASARAAAGSLSRRYSVVQIHNPPDFLMLAALVPKLLGSKVVFDVHDLSSDMFTMRFADRPGGRLIEHVLRAVETSAARAADLVVTVHRPYQRELVARGVPPEKVHVVMNSLDERLPHAAPAANGRGDIVVVYHGTLTPHYGVHVLVEAVAHAARHVPRLCLEIYGHGDALPYLKQRAADLGISSRVTFAGAMSHTEVLSRVSCASIGVVPNLPTRLNRFALSSKLFEYIVLGIPVVSSDLPTIREHFPDGELLFFRAGDPGALADALIAVAEDPEGAASRATVARRRYLSDYAWSPNAERYASLLGTLARSRARPSRPAQVSGLPAGEPPRETVTVRERLLSPVALEASEPFVFFEHFRVPYRITDSARLAVKGETPPRLADVCARIVTVQQAAASRSLYWPSRTRSSGLPAVIGFYRLDDTTLYGRVVPDVTSKEWFSYPGSTWTRRSPIVDERGDWIASTWADEYGNIFLPFDPSEIIENFWREAYWRIGEWGQRLSRLAAVSYYHLRPALARPAQLYLRRAYSRIQARSSFPRWPVEPALDRLFQFLFATTASITRQPVPSLSAWPKGSSWALVLTHDVETWIGVGNVRRLCGLEADLGYRSSWNFVPKRYHVEEAFFDELKQDGFEVGVHGLYHDGHDINSKAFHERLPEIRHYAERWGAVGFRSPSTLRDWNLMSKLGFEYDSSYPDTDPFEPQPGGCCSLLPFFNGSVVELPITLVQDHTLFDLLLHPDERLWVEKAEYVRSQEGMALLLTHPDYFFDAARYAAYARFLRRFHADPTAWRALPREAAAWWRRRAATGIEWIGDEWRTVGPAASEAELRLVSP